MNSRLTWFPPDFGLIKTSTGVSLVVGTDLITNAFDSFSFDFFFEISFLRDVLRNDDLKLPLRGNLIIHDGGTIIFECSPDYVWNCVFVFCLRNQTKQYEMGRNGKNEMKC